MTAAAPATDLHAAGDGDGDGTGTQNALDHPRMPAGGRVRSAQSGSGGI
ncbi:hypothetical protein SCOCK_30393 [Actinacidiphila cocklensis]|uniref:Uncharacterized protein n=1 Tax=Actinacidiphila cocklensis TaxID=887465 RepID=A0A9W4DWF0_9ACTN|nr:hypothetical protein SCOCK_30393 [Actinacidiphila cocklensis]